MTIYGVSAADQHVHGWDARRASHVTGFVAAPTSRCQLDLILFLVDSAAVGGGKWGRKSSRSGLGAIPLPNNRIDGRRPRAATKAPRR
jgi:hypothetical protein